MLSSAPARRPLTVGHLVRFAAAAILLFAVMLYGSARFVIGIDDQVMKCLDYRVFVLDTFRQPKPLDLDVGDLIAVRLTADQRPSNVSWPEGITMVKRVEATVPGTRITVSREGIRFELNGRTWTHGTALESAALLGRTEASFERTFELKPGELFLMGDNLNSYDGRYYGPVTEDQVVGAVLWAI